MFRTEPMQRIRIVCLYEDKQEVTGPCTGSAP